MARQPQRPVFHLLQHPPHAGARPISKPGSSINSWPCARLLDYKMENRSSAGTSCGRMRSNYWGRIPCTTWPPPDQLRLVKKVKDGSYQEGGVFNKEQAQANADEQLDNQLGTYISLAARYEETYEEAKTYASNTCLPKAPMAPPS